MQDVRTFISRLAEFPERRTIRQSEATGLGVIEYRRSLSIAFIVRADAVVILGFFYVGRKSG